MKKSIIRPLITSFLFVVVAIVCTVFLKHYDLAPVAAGGTEIGAAALNTAFHEWTGVHMTWYTITTILGYVAIAVMVFFFLCGVKQLFQKKKIFSVNGGILALGITYILLLALYAYFEKFPLNFRPILMPGATEPDASFPSSHTMLALVTFATAVLQWHRMFPSQPKLRHTLHWVVAIAGIVTVAGRLYCGIHWFTDVLIGIFISLAFIFFYSGLSRWLISWQEKKTKQ